MDLFAKCKDFRRAKDLIEAGIYPYFRAISEHHATRATVGGREMIMVGSNNYLGLTHHEKVLSAVRDAVARYGSSCTGSRFLNGTLELHVELEKRLARFMGMEAACVFSTGFHVNLGTISSLLGRRDVVFCDRENHASIIDGCRLGFGDMVKFAHDDMEDLETKLAAYDEDAGKLIVVDGVFSMNGSLTDLPSVVALAKKYGARVMVDDAHGIGALGATGRGTLEHYGLIGDPSQPVDLVMGTFSKSLASLGGFIAGSEEVVHYIKHTARPVVFSASPSPANTAAALAALEIIDDEPWRVQRLHEICERVRAEFQGMGYDTMGSQTPIIPVLVGSDEETLRFWKALDQRGLFVNPVIPPATPPGKGLIRTSYMASHSDEEIDRVLEVFGALAPLRQRILEGTA